ncbi:hypothetical protein B0H14DRAFT_3730344 [Mycena olivaceomarginata]|nr:hypothetical protein B0H14DRAFT_3730344 [Mycena olivaceomarginata]
MPQRRKRRREQRTDESCGEGELGERRLSTAEAPKRAAGSEDLEGRLSTAEAPKRTDLDEVVGEANTATDLARHEKRELIIIIMGGGEPQHPHTPLLVPVPARITIASGAPPRDSRDTPAGSVLWSHFPRARRERGTRARGRRVRGGWQGPCPRGWWRGFADVDRGRLFGGRQRALDNRPRPVLRRQQRAPHARVTHCDVRIAKRMRSAGLAASATMKARVRCGRKRRQMRRRQRQSAMLRLAARVTPPSFLLDPSSVSTPAARAQRRELGSPTGR